MFYLHEWLIFMVFPCRDKFLPARVIIGSGLWEQAMHMLWPFRTSHESVFAFGTLADKKEVQLADSTNVTVTLFWGC